MTATIKTTSRMGHDEQDDEAFYDDRSEADNDMEKGKLMLPQNKLFGREEELRELQGLYSRFVTPDASTITSHIGSPSSLLRLPSSQLIFVDGYSGVGKSAFVQAFVDRLLQEESSLLPVIYASGKYLDTSSTAANTAPLPFSAISQALAMMAQKLAYFLGASKLQNLHYGLRAAGFGPTSEDSTLLLDIIPGMAHLLQDTTSTHGHHASTAPERKVSGNSASTSESDTCRTAVSADSSYEPTCKDNKGTDKKHLALLLGTFLRVLSNYITDTPIVLFLDDLQWADPASLDLLQHPILQDASFRSLFFIGAFQRTQAGPDTALMRMIHYFETSPSTVKGAGSTAVHRMHLSNLSPRHIHAFIAETMGRKCCEDDPEAISQLEPLVQLVYSRTLGNIFFCREAMEELLRKKAIYYDVMSFRWEFNLLGLELETPLSDNIVQMIQDKVQSFDNKALQRVLIVSAYLRHVLNPVILLACLKVDEASCSNSWTIGGLQHLLSEAVQEGLLLHTASSTGHYKFAHDRIQEALYNLVPPGTERHSIMARIGEVLMKLESRSSFLLDDDGLSVSADTTNGLVLSRTRSCQYEGGQGNEWMLFVALDCFNALPADKRPCDTITLVRLNCRLGNSCLQKASFEQAVLLFQAAVDAIESARLWNTDYEVCLIVYKRLLETELALGHFNRSQRAIDAVLQNARCLQDRVDAHCTRVQMLVKQHDDNHALGAKEAASLLSHYGHSIPEHPTKADILMERLRFKIALGSRPLSVIAELPLMQDDCQMKLLAQLVYISNVAGNSSLHLVACLRAMRISLEQGVSKYLPIILTDHSSPMRREGKFHLAYSYASVVQKLHERFPHSRGAEYATSRLILHSGMLHLKQPFVDSIDTFLANYRMALAAGSVDIALTSAMHFPLIYFASGLPLNALLEPKLILFQDKAHQLDRPCFEAIFRMCRQVLYNLQGKSKCPTAMNGEAIQEDQVLNQLKGSALKVTFRDISILRLMLAYLFGDCDTMEAMMKRLDSIPLFDLPLVRQQLRFTFHGLAALTLGRTQRNRHLLAKGQSILKELRKLDHIGSANAHPVYLCLKAADRHTRAAYEEAIAACASARLAHLEAMMTEQCGLLLLHIHKEKNEKQETARSYLTRAYWLYHEWGAEGKTRQLQERHDFLSNIHRVGTTVGKAIGRTSSSSFFVQADHFNLRDDDYDYDCIADHENKDTVEMVYPCNGSLQSSSPASNYHNDLSTQSHRTVITVDSLTRSLGGVPHL